MKNNLTAEQFLRDKLESEISSLGDGMSSFHTRDIEHLLKCLDDKDDIIRDTEGQCVELINKINFNAEEQFKELLNVCMTINNLSSEQRLRYIRKTYSDVWRSINKNNSVECTQKTT